MIHSIEKRIVIPAVPEKVWECLTDPVLMTAWMGDEGMEIEVIAEWKVGGAFTIKGFHHAHFENKGTILQLEPGKVFQYEYLSSLSNLEDKRENYTAIAFTLVPKENGTELTVEAKNFPTFEIYKHLEFYWNGTVEVIKREVRGG